MLGSRFFSSNPCKPLYYLNAKIRSARHAVAKTHKRRGWVGLGLMTTALLLAYVLLVPAYAGALGRWVAHLSMGMVGQGAVLVPWICAVMGWKVLRVDQALLARSAGFHVGVLWLVCTVLAIAGGMLGVPEAGGVIGHATEAGLTRLVGRWGTGLLTGVWAMAMGLVLVKRSPHDVLHWIVGRVQNDWQGWRRAVEAQRRLQKEIRPRPVTPKRWKPTEGARGDPSCAPTGLDDSAAGLQLGPNSSPSLREGSSDSGVPNDPSRPRRQATSLQPGPPLTPSRVAPPSADGRPSGIQESLDQSQPLQARAFQRPSLELLTTSAPTVRQGEQREALLANARLLEQTLADFRVDAKVVDIHPGPVITRYDLAPAPGVKVQAIAGLANDIALAMKAMSLRVLAPVPGKAAVGIEIPSPQPELVTLRDIMAHPTFQEHASPLTIALGKTTDGTPTVADLAQMPHLLIAGSTGAGKSICIHSLIVSLMYKSTPAEVKFLLIDPKRLELPLYQGVPYLYDPSQPAERVTVITDSKEAAKSLTRMVRIMEQRFHLFAHAAVRDIQQYNQHARQQGIAPVYSIVVIIDELADLMAVASKEVEGAIQRLAQMARAVGIHLVLATQRPSVDVITGVIKANLPARLAFRVASQTDSRVIIDMAGAETLLGQGDMLFLPPGAPKPVRLQGAFLSSKEIQAVIAHARQQGVPAYEDLLVRKAAGTDPVEDEQQELLRQALHLVLERKRVSQDLLKAHFGSSARATDLLSLLEVQGFIAKPEGTNRWTVFFERIEEYLKSIGATDPSTSGIANQPLRRAEPSHESS